MVKKKEMDKNLNRKDGSTHDDEVSTQEEKPKVDKNISLDEKSDSQAENTLEDDASSEIDKKLEDALKEAAEQKDLALRTLAEMENLRKRTRVELENAHKYALDKFVKELIPVLDSMELGLTNAEKEEVEISNIVEGMNMTFKQMLDVLQMSSIERISPDGELFNPELHEAMTMVSDTEMEPNTVIDVIQKGYVLNGRVLRPARVIVSK